MKGGGVRSLAILDDAIHLFPKWLPFKYSFVFIQISP